MRSFSADGYVELIRAIRRTRSVLAFSEFWDRLSRDKLAQGDTTIRHDVDFSLGDAVAMASADSREGIVSIFFLRPSAETYSLLNARGVQACRTIASLGHEVGLHFDRDVVLAAPDPVMFIRGQVELLRSLTGQAIDFAVQHNSTLVGAGETPLPAGTLDIGREWDAIAGPDRARYLSDSSRHFREPTWHELLTTVGPPIQVLIHPEWWRDDGAGSREEVIARIGQRRAGELRTDLDAYLRGCAVLERSGA